MIKVLIIDDDMMVRKYVNQMVEWEKYGMKIVGEAFHGLHAIEQIKLLNPDIALLDVAMPVMDGISFVKYVRENSLPIKIIMLSCRDDFEYVKEAMRLGASDYLLKHSVTFEEIIKVIQNISNDQGISSNQRKHSIRSEDNTRNYISNERSSLDNKVITKAIEYIERNISKSISLEEVADHVHLNKVYFSQLFKQQMKINFIDYILELRIDEAKKVLSESDEKIYIVAEMVGFNNQYHFIRTFKKMVGLSPGVFRKSQMIDKPK